MAVIAYLDGSVTTLERKGAGSGAGTYIFAQAKSSCTANVLVAIRASSSGFVAFPGSTLGLGSEASFMYSPDVFIGVRSGSVGDTLPSGCMGWFQDGGKATIYFATGATVVAGYGYQMITGGKTAMMTALCAAYTGLPFHTAIALEAPDGAAATYTTAMLVPGVHKALLTT